MVGANNTTIPTSESVKEYIDSNANPKNYSMLKCTTTTTSSTVNGEVNAVVIKFDSVVMKSAVSTIISYGSSGDPGVGDTEYSWSTNGGDFEMSWNIGTNTNLVNNRAIFGVKMQSGMVVSGPMVWSDLNPTDSFIYDRGLGQIRMGSTSGSTLVNPTLSPKIYYRLILWKLASSDPGTNAITLLDSCQITIKQIN